ncbi:MAG: DUF2497 domain-containing protein [Pseudomonadota bacterium]
MAKGNVAAEPSMEEILASIRRIIADEEPGASAKTQEFIANPLPDEAGFTAPPVSDDVLDLGAEEEMAAESIPARPITPVDMDDVSFNMTEQAQQRPMKNEWNENVNKQPQPQQQYQMPQQQRSAAPPPMHGGIVSAHTESAANAAFNSLASAIFSTESRTIEDLTKEMLKPMLKQWLDENLASMVERLVRDEIERVARGRR